MHIADRVSPQVIHRARVSHSFSPLNSISSSPPTIESVIVKRATSSRCDDVSSARNAFFGIDSLECPITRVIRAQLASSSRVLSSFGSLLAAGEMIQADTRLPLSFHEDPEPRGIMKPSLARPKTVVEVVKHSRLAERNCFGILGVEARKILINGRKIIY
jgi:hypothetical protein